MFVGRDQDDLDLAIEFDPATALAPLGDTRSVYQTKVLTIKALTAWVNLRRRKPLQNI